LRTEKFDASRNDAKRSGTSFGNTDSPSKRLNGPTTSVLKSSKKSIGESPKKLVKFAEEKNSSSSDESDEEKIKKANDDPEDIEKLFKSLQHSSIAEKDQRMDGSLNTNVEKVL
jgi:hypothetical protein